MSMSVSVSQKMATLSTMCFEQSGDSNFLSHTDKFTSMKIEEISGEITCACNEIRMWIQKRFYPVMLPAKAQFCYELMASNIAECWFVTFLALFMTNLSRSENYNFLFKVLIRFPSKFEECIVNIFTWNSFHIQ